MQYRNKVQYIEPNSPNSHSSHPLKISQSLGVL